MGILRDLNAVQICVKGKFKAINTYIETLNLICSPLQHQNIDFSEKSFQSFSNFQLGVTFNNKENPTYIFLELDL